MIVFKEWVCPLFNTVGRDMMAGKNISAVEVLADSVAKANGLELTGVEFVKEGTEKFLRIFIYKSGGVGIDDCVAVHKELDKQIDELIDIPGPYTMEVSSPGYERAFKNTADYKRFMGEEIELKLYKPLNDKKKFTGRLTGFENGVISIETEGGTMKFKEEETAKVNRIFKI